MGVHRLSEIEVNLNMQVKKPHNHHNSECDVCHSPVIWTQTHQQITHLANPAGNPPYKRY